MSERRTDAASRLEAAASAPAVPVEGEDDTVVRADPPPRSALVVAALVAALTLAICVALAVSLARGG